MERGAEGKEKDREKTKKKTSKSEKQKRNYKMTKREELQQIWETGGVSGREAQLNFLNEVYADLLRMDSNLAKKFDKFIKRWHKGDANIDTLLDVADIYRELNNKQIDTGEFANLLTPLLS